MRFIDSNGEVKLITSDRNTIGEYVSIGRGLPISALIGGKEITLYQSLNNAGYKVPILEYMGGGSWQALHAEKDPERNNINVLWMSTFPSDQPQAVQVISFSIETGEWNGIYKNDGSYDTDISQGNGGARSDCYVAPADPIYENFLTKFGYISNPQTPPTNIRNNLTGTPKEQTFWHTLNPLHSAEKAQISSPTSTLRRKTNSRFSSVNLVLMPQEPSKLPRTPKPLPEH